jgi:hypothetical protein
MDVGATGFAWASPLINGNQVYVGMASRCDNPSVRGEVRAIDATSGVSVTRQFIVPAGQAGGGIWNSPVMKADRSVLAVATGEDYGGYNGPYNRAIVSLDPASLGILGFHQQGATGQDLDYGTTPVIFHDSQGRALIGANHKNGVFYTYLLDNINAGPIWNRSTGTSVGMMPAYDPSFGAGGTLFIYGTAGRVYAVDPATGADRWPTAVTPGSAHGNMAIANGLLYFNLGSGGVQIRRESDGALLRTLTPPNLGTTNSGIAVANGFIYWVAGSYLNAWSLPPGTLTPTPPPATATAPPSPTMTAPPATATRTVAPPTVTPAAPTATGTPGAPSATPQAPTATATPGGPSATPAAPTATGTPGGPTATPAPPSATTTPCAISFSDVHPTDYFYTPAQYLACHGVISGYADGTFRPYNDTTRSQMVKIVVNAFAVPAYAPPGGGYTFADVPPAQPFFSVIEAAAHANIVSGYTCGGPGEPCDNQNRPYFRPFGFVTRGQLSKIVVVAAEWTVANPARGAFADVLPNTAFYTFVETAYCHGIISGYTCGGAGEPCDNQSRPYFRQFNNATRGQIAKIVYNALTAGAACAP